LRPQFPQASVDGTAGGLACAPDLAGYRYIVVEDGIVIVDQSTTASRKWFRDDPIGVCTCGKRSRSRSGLMKRRGFGALSAIALIAFTSYSHSQAADPGVELAFMPRTMTVTLLNEGGKYVAIDMKHIPQGGTCRMDKDATVARVGPGAKPGTTRVRYAAAQISPGGCPFLTMFELSDTDYAAARASFGQMKDDASKKVEEIKKDLGEKWDEVIGKKK
jgi:hypothetical protein